MSAEWPEPQPAWRALWRHSLVRLAAVAGLLGAGCVAWAGVLAGPDVGLDGAAPSLRVIPGNGIG